MMMKRAVAIGLALVVLAGVGCRKEQVGKSSPTLVAVQPVGMFTPEATATKYSAAIVPESQYSLAFKVSGYVEEILRIGGRLAQEGDYVTKGQILARVRQSDYATRVAQANAQMAAARKTVATAVAQVAEAEAGLVKATADWKRAEALYATKSLTRPDYDSAKAQLDSAQAKVTAAKSQVGTAEENFRAAEAVVAEAVIPLDDTRLTVPENGLILKREIEIGVLASPGAPAFDLADIRTVKAVFGVPDTELPRVKMGMELQMNLEAIPDEVITGKVSAISPVADSKTRVFSIEVSIPNAKRVLLPGMIVSVSLAGDAKPVQALTVIPLSAVVRSKENPSLFSVAIYDSPSEMGKAKFRMVRLGDIYGNQVAVLDGLKPGETIVVSGAQQILDGELVRATR